MKPVLVKPGLFRIAAKRAGCSHVDHDPFDMLADEFVVGDVIAG